MRSLPMFSSSPSSSSDSATISVSSSASTTAMNLAVAGAGSASTLGSPPTRSATASSAPSSCSGDARGAAGCSSFISSPRSPAGSSFCNQTLVKFRFTQKPSKNTSSCKSTTYLRFILSIDKVSRLGGAIIELKLANPDAKVVIAENALVAAGLVLRDPGAWAVAA